MLTSIPFVPRRHKPALENLPKEDKSIIIQDKTPEKLTDKSNSQSRGESKELAGSR